jgi:hypothetical protein
VRPQAALPLAAVLAALAGCGDGAAPPPPAAAPPAATASKPAFSAPAGRRQALVWAIGDGADGSAAARRVAARAARDRPVRVLYLGDVYPAGSASDMRGHFGAVFRALLRRTLPTAGNHEWPARAQGYDAFWARRTGVRTPAWYAVRLAGWTLLSLSSEAPHGTRSAQLRWLRSELRGSATCRLAFWHRPRRSAGTHGDQPDVEPFWRALRGHARIVLNGHDHDLQRWAARGGLTELVSGAGGHGHYPLARRSGLRFADDRHYGGVRLLLRPGSARIAFVAADGRVLDRSRVSCRR